MYSEDVFFDCLEMANDEDSRQEVAPPSEDQNSMNLNMDEMVHEEYPLVEQNPGASSFSPEPHSVKEEPIRKDKPSAGNNPHAWAPSQLLETPRSGVPKIRIEREQEIERGQSMRSSPLTDLQKNQEKKGPKFQVVKGPSAKNNGDKFKREPVSILIIVGLAIWNAGEALGPTPIYEFFTTHFIKYTAEEKNKNSWRNTVRTKLSFADKFTKILAPGLRTCAKYALNGNWLETELENLDRNNFFADSGLVEPKVWEQMRQGKLGLPKKHVNAVSHSSKSEPVDDVAARCFSAFENPMPRAVLPPIRRVPSHEFQSSRGMQSFLLLNNRITAAPAERPVNMPFRNSQEPSARPRPYPAPFSRQPLARIQNQQPSVSDPRAAFARALQNQNRLRKWAIVHSQLRNVQQEPHQIQPSFHLEQRNVNHIPQQELVRQPPAIPAPEPFPNFDNMPIEDFDAEKMLGLC